jgi:hypothetical protein
MEFDTKGLSRFILHLFTGHPMDVEDSDIEEVDVTDLPNIDRLETRNNVDQNNSNNHDNNNNNNNNNNDDDDDEDDEVNKKYYCFIVFNNPKLSKLLKTKVLKKPDNVRIFFISMNVCRILLFLFRQINKVNDKSMENTVG